MGFLSGIWGNNPQQSQPQAQQQPGQQQPNPNGPGNSVVQQNTAQQGTGQNQGGGNTASGQRDGPQNSNFQGGDGGNPLDAWMQKLQPQQDPNAQQQQQQPESLFGNTDPEQLRAMVSKANFVEGVDPQKIQAALSGDVNAFMEVLNATSQNAFMRSIQMGQGMVEHGVKAGTERFSKGLDSQFKEFMLKQQNSQNPVLQHPLGQAFLSSTKSQLAKANPKLTAAEIQTQAEQMLTDFAKMLNPNQMPTQGDPTQPRNSTDWEAFMSS